MAQQTSQMGSTQLAAKPRLPELRPNMNRRAQQIIAAHMRSASSASTAFSSMATVPVLTQIASTAPRTARTHDISHLCDTSTYLTPSIPPSLVAEEDHIFETSFMPLNVSSKYNEQDGLWHTKVFPSNTPSSRTDAVLLDAWITRSLERYQQTSACAAKEDLARAVEDLVPILSVALHEIVRQVTHHCIERGVGLEKIWRTYVELFDRVLSQMQDALLAQKSKALEAQNVLAGAREELQGLRKSHPEQMHRVIAELEEKFSTRQQEFEDALKQAEEDNIRLKQELRTHHRELEMWYPSFGLYRESYIKNHIPQFTRYAKLPTNKTADNNSQNPSSGALNPTVPEFRGRRPSAASPRHSMLVDPSQVAQLQEGAEPEFEPEVAIAEDFKRLLAVLAPEKRKGIGKELSFIMDPPKERSSSGANKQQSRRYTGNNESDGAESRGSQNEQQVVESLKTEVRQQEERIRELREEISTLEHHQAGVEGREAAAAAAAAQSRAGANPDEEEDAQAVAPSGPAGPNLMDAMKKIADGGVVPTKSGEGGDDSDEEKSEGDSGAASP